MASNLLIILSSILVFVKSFEYPADTCKASSHTQSPVSLLIGNSIYYEETTFRLFHNEYKNIEKETKWKVFRDINAVGIEADFAADEKEEDKSFGSILLAKDWAIYRFNLTRIIFRLPGEHMVEGESFAAEVQLEHTLDHSYNNPGKRIELDVEKMIIALPFRLTVDYDPQQTQLFEKMNLQGFAEALEEDEVTMNKTLKLKHLIQNQPMFFYKGSLSHSGCDKAVVLVPSHFHLISKKHLELLRTVLTKHKLISSGLLHGKTISGNARTFDEDFKQVAPEVYRNYEERAMMNPTLNYFHYNLAKLFQIGVLAFISLMIFI